MTPRPNRRQQTSDLNLRLYTGGRPQAAPRRWYPALFFYPVLGIGLGWIWYAIISRLYRWLLN